MTTAPSLASLDFSWKEKKRQACVGYYHLFSQKSEPKYFPFRLNLHMETVASFCEHHLWEIYMEEWLLAKQFAFVFQP